MKIKVGIQNLLPEQKNSVPPGKDVSEAMAGVPYAGDELGVVPDKKSKEQKYKDAYPDPLKEFKSSGANRGQLQISLEFLDDVTYERLSKAAREDDISKFTRIVQNAEKNAFKKKKQLIGVIAALDVATVPLGIKWYKDIAIGFMAGYAQMEAEAALQAFVDSDMSSVLMDLYPLFRLKQPQNKTEAVKIIKEEDPSLLLPMKYQAPEGPGFLDLFGNYDEYFKVKEGTWKEPLYEAFQRAYSSIDNILKIYSYPSISKSSLRAGAVKGALEGFSQFLNDVKIYTKGSVADRRSGEGAKRSRSEAGDAMGHVIDLSKAVIEVGEHLKLIEKYKDDPKMIIGAYEAYAKVDPVPVNKRVRILLKFLEKLSEEKLNYVGGLPPQMLRRQEAATDMLKSINKLFTQRTLQIAKDKDSKALSNFDASGLLNQEGFKVKKIKINLKEIATNVDTLKESRFKFLDDLLGTPAPRVSLGDLGAQSIQVAGKRVLRSASVHKSVKDPATIKVVDDYIDAATDGAENLESITKRAAAEAALEGAPIIVKIEKKLDLLDSSTGKPFVYTKYILVAEDGLVAVGRESDFSALERLSRKVKEAQEARKTTGAAPADAPRPSRVEPPAPDALAPKGSLDNPFRNFKEAENAYSGRLIGSLKRFYDTAYRRSIKYPGLFFPIKTGRGDADFAFYGAPGKPVNAAGFVDGKLTPITKAIDNIEADEFWSHGLDDVVAHHSGLGSDIFGLSRIDSLWQYLKVPFYLSPKRELNLLKKLYFGEEFIKKGFGVQLFRSSVFLTDLVTMPFGPRLVESGLMTLIRELGLVSEKKILSAYRVVTLGRAAIVAAYVGAIALSKYYQGANALIEEASAIEEMRSKVIETSDKEVQKRLIESIASMEKTFLKEAENWAKHNGHEDALPFTDYAETKEFLATAKDKAEQFADKVPMKLAKTTSRGDFLVPDFLAELVPFYNDTLGKLLLDEAEKQVIGYGKEFDKSYEALVNQILKGVEKEKEITGSENAGSSKGTPTIKTPLGAFGRFGDPLTPEKRKEYLDDEQEFDDFKASGFSERDFTEWKATVSPADYVRWRKSKQTVDQWLDDEIDEKIYNEHNDLGAVLGNYFGNNIIKNIKIGSKTGPRSGDKK